MIYFLIRFPAYPAQLHYTVIFRIVSYSRIFRQAAFLDHRSSQIRHDLHAAARQYGTFHSLPSDTYCCGLRKNNVFQFRDLLLPADHIKLISRTVLFHIDRHIMHIPRPCLQKSVHHIPQCLTGTVINIAFQLVNDIFAV